MISPLSLPVGFLLLLTVRTFADFPYNPTRIYVTNNGSTAYIFSSQPSTSQADLQFLNTSDFIDASSPSLRTLTGSLPFSNPSSWRSITPLLNANELNVLVGDCDDEGTETELWHYTPGEGESAGTWDKRSLSSTDSTLNSGFLSAGFSFSPIASLNNASFYVFGGMCPNDTSTAETWTSNARYLNDMLSISPTAPAIASYPNSAYQSSILPLRGPPVPEAGLTITPLTPTFSNSSTTSVSQQQNFVLIGGHTQQAFINMSQVAIFSLPQESWSFKEIKHPESGETDLVRRSNRPEIEPRSGHTAVITRDGSKIIVFGGWVGDVSTPAEPQLAILEIGQGYGGVGEWKWTTPSTSDNPMDGGRGIYGHAAAMLEGDVMLVYGGYSISASPRKVRRQNLQASNNQMFLFNTTSSSFISTYTRPTASQLSTSVKDNSSTGALHTTSQKVGLGAGLVLGFAALAGIVTVYIVYSRRLRQRRSAREKELRELALGAERYYSGDLIGAGVDVRGGPYPEMRSASWGSRQEKRISSPGDSFPWAPAAPAGQGQHSENGRYGNGEREAERTGLLVEIPSPTRGLRRSLHSKGPTTYNPSVGVPVNSAYGTSPTTGEIHTITEQDEDSEASGSGRRSRSSKNKGGGIRPISDPFRDPPPQLTRSQSELDRLRREREVKGWVDDWEAAGTAMESGRPVQRSSSTKHDQSNTNTNTSRSRSPEKSDRTNSNLSERSTVSSGSIQRSVFGSISRNRSMRSSSTGYTLFANAAAAMTGRATLVHHPGPSPNPSSSTEGNHGAGVARRASSKRSASLNFNSGASTRYRPGTGGSGQSPRERSDTFLPRIPSLDLSPTRQGHGYDEVFETPPESPVRERKALGWMGSMRRALTGSAGAGARRGTDGGIGRRVEEYDSQHGTSSRDQPQMTEVNADDSPRRAASASAAFWMGKKGARDWDVDPSSPSPSLPPGAAGGGDEADSEWDVEAAVQKRLVQVMFTVPKEKLRVVNVDQLSLLSKSDVDDPGEGVAEKKDELDHAKRVSTVVEEGESPVAAEAPDESNPTWKGKGKAKQKDDRDEEGKGSS
ncbi:hypothetical protein EPUS_00759 [Endocarpon pusillum Z07020]|uniref:Uncharacterized protein n=1 Tax=Endocarpon pusillum (strain Z07020 / HMAS-L-300199) TaxID=1263415 RepID=U1HYQ7_ENDPU|nr:uncharacterized protein EPUS_00759 [Endocarpon pusillum Z07020]ERF74629.1 hypothetical protein EPUS_00759 [Endocarpon pusillum Z07020]